jgi:RNA polymerase I-specific transcription initiation factor RRN6
MGMASDLDHDSGSRQTQIMAMAHGEAGNVLRLVRPRVEKLGWHGKYGTKLRSVNPTSSETGYWTIDGSPIQNIVFASNTEGLTSRLAVQNAEGTSILWPLWHKYPIALPVTTSTGKQIHHSRLNPNPITRLTNSMTGGRPHTDVSFNPWYTRQVAVVDESGYWTTWEIESKKKKRHVVKVDPKSFGHVVDGLSADVEPKIYQSVDGWHRVMWAAELNTIVVCGRHHLSVFDIKDTSKRLPTPSLVRPNSRDCILDLKRDPNNFDQIYVLTNREIFWLQIVPAADKNLEDPSDHVGARILLSCRHYRGEDDLTGRIEVFGENGEDGCELKPGS